MSETETVVVVDDKKFYSVTSFVNDFKTKVDLSPFNELAVYFDVDEMFDCKVGSIAVKPLLILCGSASDVKKNIAFKHKSIIDLFGNVQPIITYKASKTKARPNKANGNLYKVGGHVRSFMQKAITGGRCMTAFNKNCSV